MQVLHTSSGLYGFSVRYWVRNNITTNEIGCDREHGYQYGPMKLAKEILWTANQPITRHFYSTVQYCWSRIESNAHCFYINRIEIENERWIRCGAVRPEPPINVHSRGRTACLIRRRRALRGILGWLGPPQIASGCPPPHLRKRQVTGYSRAVLLAVSTQQETNGSAGFWRAAWTWYIYCMKPRAVLLAVSKRILNTCARCGGFGLKWKRLTPCPYRGQ
jgi:hypothetical protein